MSSIMALLNQIQNDEIVLPAIQRDFVWSEEKVEKLLDSIMRGYPIGIALLWETYEDIQFRSFVKDFKPGTIHRYRENSEGRRLKLVLDGQQRLQSLYISLFGSREGKDVYLDISSGAETDDVSEQRFGFHLLSSEEAADWNEWAVEQAETPPDERDEDFPEYLVKVSRLFAMGVREKKDFVRKIVDQLRLSDEDALRMDLNLSSLDEVLSKDQNILKVSTIDENLSADSPQRKSDSDVLEIFVRINREGTPLSRSDLIFSMLKLNWKESAEGLPEFVAEINEGNSFDLDTDFVVRSLFAVSDLGTRLDLNLLRKKSNVQSLRDNFSTCCDAIRATIDFVQAECKCQSSSLLGGYNTLVPLVYYLFHTRNHEVRNNQVDVVREAVYLLSFARPFSRYADSRIGPYIRAELRPRLLEGDETFPQEETIRRVIRWERLRSLSDLAQHNEPLTLHLVQGLTGAKVQYVRNSPEIDHIFPRAQLRKKGYEEEKINHFANFWILAQGKNRNKSDRHPRDYFADVSARQMQRALIDRGMLDYRRYTTFLKQRQLAIVKKVGDALNLSDDDLEQ